MTRNAPQNTDDTIDSRDVIERIEELEEALDQNFDCEEDQPDYLRPALRVSLESAIERLKASNDESEYGETIGSWHYWISQDTSATAGLEPDDAEELQALKALADEAEGYADDWQHGAQLIRDSYFKDYAQELADDCGLIPNGATWPNNCIDWDEAARQLKQDYTSVEFDGVTYWVR